jgi:dolichol-phosphate mannosyltransferase
MKWQSGRAVADVAMPVRNLTEVRWRVFVVGLIGYAFFLRVIFSAQIELLPEEAYYWNYSRHLDIGYLDHPPMVAWLIRLGTDLFGSGEFGVRFGALCCGAVTAFFAYRLARNLFGEETALIALAMSQVLPFFFLSGMLMTPDAPLTAAWAASLYFLERALIGARPWAWLWAGLTLGLGLISKYSIGLLALVTLVFMILDAPSRRWFRRWEPYAGVLIAAAVFSPVVIWNAQHEWASFVFQTARRLTEVPRFSLHKLLGSALILLTPVGLIAVVVALLESCPPVRRSWRFLCVGVLVPVAVFVVFSLRHEVKLDWTGAPWVCAIPMLAFGLHAARARASGSKPWLRTAWPVTFVIMLVIYTAGFYHLTEGIPGVGYTRHTELLPVEWRDFGQQIDGIAAGVRHQYGDNLLVVGMDRYAIASELAFYSSDQSKAVANRSSWHLFDDMGLMYEQWFPPKLQTGRTLLLVAWDPGDLAASHLEKRVAQLEPIHDGVLTRDGTVIRRFYYRVAYGYQHES